jgi:hypothetical protein
MSAHARTFARLDAAERLVRSLEALAEGNHHDAGAAQEQHEVGGGH